MDVEEDLEEFDTTESSEDVSTSVVKKDFISARRKYLDGVRVNLEALKEHLNILKGTTTDVAEGAAVQDNLVVMMGLENGISTFIRTQSPDETSVLMERRVLRQFTVVFEVRPGSKSRSFARKVSRGTHKRIIWLINEELIVTKQLPDGKNVHHELCRENIYKMTVMDVSTPSHHLLALKFFSGFVFTAHFQSQRELEVWQSLLTPKEGDAFPWGMVFDEAVEDNSAGVAKFAAGQGKKKDSKEVVFQTLDDQIIRPVLEKIARIEGLVAAQEAALSQTGGGLVSASSTKKRQFRMQRIMFAALKDMHAISLHASRRLFGLKAPAPLGPQQKAPAPMRRRRLGAATVDDDSWSDSDDSSTDEDVYHAPIDKPQHTLRMSPQVNREVVPPMPTTPPKKISSMDLEGDVLYAVRRQLALKELELAKVKNQLANVVNENWRKNLQVAQLKKGLNDNLVAGLKEKKSSIIVGEPLVGFGETGVKSAPTLVSTAATSTNNSNNGEEDDTLADQLVKPSPRFVRHARNDSGSFLGMNVEIFRRILSHLSVADLGSLGQTSRTFDNLLKDDTVTWDEQISKLAPIMPSGLASAPAVGRKRMQLLYEKYLCASCKDLLQFGPSDDFAWEKLGLALCKKSDCFHKATISEEDAKQSLAMDSFELEDEKSVKLTVSTGETTLFARRDVEKKAYQKYGGKEGVQARLRSLFKQKQLIALSRFARVTTRPTNLLLDN